MRPSLIVHGGAWSIPRSAEEACRGGCRGALEAGWKILSQGGSALDAVEAAIIVLEDDPVFDAGVGSHLNRDGRVQLDAIVMDGRTLKAGAVAAVERIRNPVRLARRVLENSEHMMLVGAGAEQFALENGIPLCAPEELVLERERKAWLSCVASGDHMLGRHFGEAAGTVGAVAMDGMGNLVAGTSTGGTCCKFPGRVGDSPLVGCGCYADIEAGGVSSTGYGEAIMRVVLAKTAVEFLRAGKPPHEAAQMAVDVLARRGAFHMPGSNLDRPATGGLILLDREGQPGFAFNTSHMAYGYVAADSSFVVGP